MSFLTDSATSVPLVPLGRMVRPREVKVQDHPYMVINFPLYERPSGVGFNPPVPRKITPVKGDKIATGTVDETNVCGDWLVDLDKDFLNLGTKVVTGVGTVTITAAPTQTVVNTTTQAQTVVKEVCDNHTLQLRDSHIFDHVLEGYEIYQTNGEIFYLREQREIMRISVVDRDQPGHDGEANVNLITQRVREYFEDQANEELYYYGVTVVREALGQWFNNNQAFQGQSGQMIEYRRDLDVALTADFESTIVRPDVENQVFQFV